MASSPASRSSKQNREMLLDHSDTEETSSLSPPRKRRGLDLSPVIPSPYSKGKAKIGEEDVPDQAPHRCGICLSEEGRAVRGCIDICDHYFCFVCIMEWAKVESRCPMCKRRFETIRRPAKLGVYTSERIVTVPVRDQIYNGYANSSVCPAPLEVGCTVCQSEKDEKHLLLCDLCDAPSHTYCVGLGTTIPEGDWYCDDCSIAMDEHSNSEMNMNSDSSIKLPKLAQAELRVSIFDIVREHVTHSSTVTSSPVDVNNADQGFWRTTIISSVSSNLGRDRTLQRYRSVHSRIKTLRENWNALRMGTLGFSPSTTTGNNGNTNEIFEIHSETHVGNSSATTMASSSASQPVPDNVSLANAVSHGNSPDIQKAWAMLDAAKLIGQPHSKRDLIPRVSRFPSENNGRSLSKKAVASSSAQLSHGNPIDRLSREIGSQYQCMYNLQGKNKNGVSSSQLLQGNPNNDRLDKETGYQNQCIHNLQGNSNNGGYKRVVIIERKSDRSSKKMSSRFCERSQGSEIPRNSTMLSAKSIHCRDKANGGQQHFQGSSKEKAPSSSSSPITYVQSACLNFSQGPMPESSNSSVLPDSRIEHSKSKLVDDGPKAEIRALVKLNLKLLSTGRELGVNGFKEIARRATHSILAACGLEPPRPGISSFPADSLCNHRDQLRKSTLMPNCCRECFYVFVKDVVSSILSERENI